MALTAALAAALTAVCAAVGLSAGGDGSLALPAAVALGLVPAVVMVSARPHRQPLAPDRQTRLLVLATGAVVLLLYVTGRLSSAHLGGVSRLALLAVVPVSLLWPSPGAMRYCLLLSAGALVGAGPSLAQEPWPVMGVAAGAAVALVALNRHSATSVPALAPLSRTRPRRVLIEAAALLAIAGMAGLLVSALLPPPNPHGGDPRAGGQADGKADGKAESVPYLNPSRELDAGGKGSGKGDRVVLRITAPGPALWRAQTFDRWNGRAWARSDPTGPSLGGRVPRTGSALVPPGTGDLGLGVDGFVQRVTVEARSAGILVAAPRADWVEVAGRSVQFSRDGTIRAVPALGRGATYVVTSTRSTPSPEALRSSDVGSTAVPDDVALLYLQLPPLAVRVRDLAAQLAATRPTTYDKVRAVEDWIFANTTVAPGADRLPEGADPIERFLFADRKGSAEQAASSMAVMLRSLGIPARLAVGFLPGDRYALGGEFVVRSRHAHAWVEAWFPQAGWVAFDPSGRGAETVTEDSLLNRFRRLLATFWWVLAIALAVAVRWLTRRWLRGWQRQRARPWVTRWYERLGRAGRSAGRPPQPYETPAEYCAALAETTEDERLVDVGAVITAAAYSAREPPPSDRSWAERVVRDTERQHPRLPRPGRHRRRRRRLEKASNR